MDAIKRSGATLPQEEAPQEPVSDSPASPLSAEQVCRDYAPRVYSMARRMVSNDTDAEDVTQDVLLQVVRKLPTFRGESAFPTWLHRVTVNTALSHRRRLAVRAAHGLRNTGDLLPDDEALQAPDRLPPPDGIALGLETRQRIEQAIARLPAAYRTVFVLADLEDLPNAEVADRLDMTLPAVKSPGPRRR